MMKKAKKDAEADAKVIIEQEKLRLSDEADQKIVDAQSNATAKQQKQIDALRDKLQDEARKNIT